MPNGSVAPQIDKDALWQVLSSIFQNSNVNESGFVLDESFPMPDGTAVNAVTSEEVDDINEVLRSAIVTQNSGLVWPAKAEYMLTVLGEGHGFDRLVAGKEFKGEGEGALSYRIGRPSKEFAAFLICTLYADEAGRKQMQWSMMRHRIRSLERRDFQERRKFNGTSLLDVVAEVILFTTMQIESPVKRIDFEILANSFLFQAAYNMDVAARLSHGLEHLLRGSRIQRVRRVRPGEFDPPRQTYDADLVHHYLMGVAAEIPLLQYLAFYHIAEHYFEKIFNDDLVEQVRKTLIDPAFSIRRAKDVHRIVRVVNKAQRQIREEGGVNEQRALHLVVEKFVDIDRLIQDIEAYDPALVDFYRDNGVPFAEAGRVDLRDHEASELSLSIAKRIYKVRNALVHAKEGSLPRYAPFAHDAALSKEVPLIRFVAEQIVISHGRMI